MLPRVAMEPTVSIEQAAKHLGIDLVSVMRLIKGRQLVVLENGVTVASLKSRQQLLENLKIGLVGPQELDDVGLTEDELEDLMKDRPGQLPWENA